MKYYIFITSISILHFTINLTNFYSSLSAGSFQMYCFTFVIWALCHAQFVIMVVNWENPNQDLEFTLLAKYADTRKEFGFGSCQFTQHDVINAREGSTN